MSSLSTQLGHNKNKNNINVQKSSFVQQVQLFKNSLQTDKNADKHKYIFNMFASRALLAQIDFLFLEMFEIETGIVNNIVNICVCCSE